MVRATWNGYISTPVGTADPFQTPTTMAAIGSEDGFPTTVSRLVHGNDTPSPDEAAFIQQAIEMKEQEAAIARLKLQELETRISELTRQVATLRPVLTSLRRLPLETLSEIFKCIPPTSHMPNIVITLCLVSQKWRDAAELTPQLWSVLPLCLDSKFTYEAVVNWLGRARGITRTLFIRVGQSKCGCTAVAPEERKRICSFANPTLIKILTEGPLLHSVELKFPDCLCLLHLSQSILPRDELNLSRAWDSLKNLTINLSEFDHWFAVHQTDVFLCLPSSVTSLQLYLPSMDDWYDWKTPILDSNVDLVIKPEVLKNLISLELKCDWLGCVAYKMLQHCANLSELKLDLGRGLFNDYDPQLPWMKQILQEGLCLEHLQILHLKDVYASFLDDLELLQLPALLELSILFGYADWSWDGDDDSINIDAETGHSLSALTRGAVDSGSKLQVLCITNGVFEDDTLLNVIRDLSSLERLTLNNVIFGADLFPKLPALVQRLPNLQAVEMHGIHPRDDEGVLVALRDSLEAQQVEVVFSKCRPGMCVH
ncbi:hypothetical protein NMY22_g6767 [Coprinellus aureogranulatus]|nr:hypothetical protein NMY22_g6767 [Coprinellus aureogranulatus]